MRIAVLLVAVDEGKIGVWLRLIVLLPLLLSIVIALHHIGLTLSFADNLWLLLFVAAVVCFLPLSLALNVLLSLVV